MKYITKEDVEPLTNIKISSLSFLVQLHHFVRSNNKFDINSSFVVSHWNKYKFIERYHESFYSKNVVKFFGWVQICDSYEGWATEVCEWWNSYITSNYYKKKLHLYLYGSSNVGKTSFVSRILSQVSDKLVYRPSYGMFGFQDWNERYEITVIEEFNILSYDIPYLLMYLEGMRFKAPRKCMSSIEVYNKKPVIIVSNDSLQHVPLSNRVKEVYALSPFWLSEEILLPKKIVLSETILIEDG